MPAIRLEVQNAHNEHRSVCWKVEAIFGMHQDDGFGNLNQTPVMDILCALDTSETTGGYKKRRRLASFVEERNVPGLCRCVVPCVEPKTTSRCYGM